jgi:hypothetical protein
MGQSTKHGIMVEDEMQIWDLDWISNDVKYCVHSDGVGKFDFTAERVHFECSNCYPVGMGGHQTQSHVYRACEFEKSGVNVANGVAGSHGVFWHNTAGQQSQSTLLVEDSTFTNCGTVTLLELNSGQDDIVIVDNCTTDDVGASKGIYISGALGDRYCINITQYAGTMPDFSYKTPERADAASYYTLIP